MLLFVFYNVLNCTELRYTKSSSSLVVIVVVVVVSSQTMTVGGMGFVPERLDEIMPGPCMHAGHATRFWERGQGCRDLHKLNRNDSHKHHSKNKTRSAKASRVGPKPWSKGGSGTAGGGVSAAREDD